MPNIRNLQAAWDRLRTAEGHFESAGDRGGGEVHMRPGAVLTSSQRCIEHAAKSIYLLMGVSPPTEHSVSVDSEESRQLLNALHSRVDPTVAELGARLIFIAQVWGSAYPVSEYGVDYDQATIEADNFLDRFEADQAYNHAEAALSLARQIVNWAEKHGDNLR